MALRTADSSARPEVGDELFAAFGDVEDLGQFRDALVEQGRVEQLGTGAVHALRVVLSDAFGRHDPACDPRIIEHLARADRPLRTDHPLVGGDDELRLLCHDAFEARRIVGEALDRLVDLGEFGQDGIDPQRGALHLVGEAEHVEDLGRALADADDAVRRLLDGDLVAAARQLQRIAGGRERHRRQGESGDERRREPQHRIPSVAMLAGRRKAEDRNAGRRSQARPSRPARLVICVGRSPD